MEHAIGTKITLEVVEPEDAKCPCKGCIFDGGTICTIPVGWDCKNFTRTDHKSIIYKEAKEDKQ